MNGSAARRGSGGADRPQCTWRRNAGNNISLRRHHPPTFDPIEPKANDCPAVRTVERRRAGEAACFKQVRIVTRIRAF
jgi:hypothetical protein